MPAEYPDYSKVEYWNARYKEEKGQTYDWYLTYEQTKKVMQSVLQGD